MKSSRLEYARDISSVFAKVMRQYRECSDQVQKVVDQMIEVLNAPESDDTERDMALSTLTEALFPDYDDEEGGDNVLGMELTETEKACATHQTDGPGSVEELDRQEHAFAERLRAQMERRGITQTDLAEKTGVSQPAISQMLKRSCRPQIRTVRRLAEALGVSPEELWPSPDLAQSA
jgi:lambda repressor-like predicted transcriptional regulator